MSVRSRLDHNEIPRGWAQKRFGDFASLQRGYDLPATDRVSGDVPVIGSNGVVGYHNQSMVTGPGVLTGRSGTMGLSHYVDRDFWPLNTALFVTDFHSNFPLFAHYFFSFFDFGRFAAGASVPTLNRNLVHDASVFVPPLIEQRAIAGVLSKVQSAVEVREKIVGGLRELKAATMAKLFREGLRGERRKQTEIGEIPRSWEVVPLGRLADHLSGGTPSKKDDRYWRGEIPWVSPKDMKRARLYDAEDHISPDGVAEGSRLVPAKTIFIVVRGMILARDIPVAITEVPMAFNQDMKALVPNGSISPDYLLYAIISQKDALWAEIGTAAHGTRRIGSDAIEKLMIPVPKKDEQDQIASVLFNLESACEVAQRRMSALRTLFSSTLHLLMTGQVRVPVSKEA